MIESTEQKETSHFDKPNIASEGGYHFLGSRTERVVFLILITLLSAGPIIFGKSIPSHADWHIHIEHAYNFKKCFWQGELLPRWIDAQASGYGQPIFNFYAPLVYYLFTLLDLIFKDPIHSIKAAFVIPMILCTVFGYIYLRRHGSALSSAIVMSFVVFSPAIHIFIYNTNWPTSTLGLAFLFLTLYGIDRFNKNVDLDMKSLLIISIGYAGMALAHLATAFLFSLIAVPYFLLNLYIHRTKKFVKVFVLGIILGAALAGFYLFPACLEKNLVHTDEVLTAAPLWDYSKNFLFTYLDRHRDDGYAWAIFDHRYYEVSNALFSLAVLICMLPLILNMDKVKKYFLEPFRVKIAIIMFSLCFLMMTPVTIFIWLMIKPLQTVQFPWRFTAFILPFGALVMVYAFDFIGKLIKEQVYIGGYKIIFYSLIAILSMLLYVDSINMYRWKWVPEQSLYKAAINVLWGNEEYRPNLTGNPQWKSFNFKKDFSASVESSNPSADITPVKWLSHERIVNVFSPEEHQFRFRIFYFPGWNVYIDGNKIEVKMDPQIGSMVVTVPSGKHQIAAKFEITEQRKISTYISLGALALYIYLLISILKKKKFNFGNIAKLRGQDTNSTEVTLL